MNLRSFFKKISIILILISIFFSNVNFVLAETKEEQEARWRAELEQTEKDIAKWQEILNTSKKGTASLQKEADLLNAKIQQAKAFIKAKNIAIEKLRGDIEIKNKTISTLEQKIEKSKESLASLIKKTNEMDSYSLPEVFLAGKNLSEFFSSVDSYKTLNRSLSLLLDDIRDTKNLTQKEKELLDQKRNKEIDLKENVEDEKAQVEKNEKEKQYLIKINKTQEKSYEQVIKERQKRAAEIRAALFALRDSASIPFGDAYRYAQEAERKTGIRPAFLLAILTQESNLGKNVGRCNRADGPDTQKWQAIMPGPDDIKKGLSKRDDEGAFLRITSALGLDPNAMPLSCPLASGGWGGAMGPSQFIPTTWESYAPRVAQELGKSIVNPWNPEDAFMASATYLADLGAGAQTFTSERTAALKYYAGGNWNKRANAFYGDQVMARAKDIQTNMIDPLNF